MTTNFTVIVGGGWANAAPRLRALKRERIFPFFLYYGLGFRLVKADNEVPDSGEGEKPDTTCSNGEQP